MFSRIWIFLKDKENRATLQWLAMAAMAIPPAAFGLMNYVGVEASEDLKPVASLFGSAPMASEEIANPGPQQKFCSRDIAISAGSDQLIFPNSSDLELTSAQIASRNSCELWIAKNEIYARKGYVFRNQYLEEYFNRTDWYQPGGFTGLEAIETQNVSLLDNYLNK